MLRKNATIILLSASVLAACASTTPYYDSRYGLAVNTAKARQTVNPDASRSADPVAGMDGRAAKEGVDRYHDSFRAPERTFDVITGGR